MFGAKIASIPISCGGRKIVILSLGAWRRKNPRTGISSGNQETRLIIYISTSLNYVMNVLIVWDLIACSILGNVKVVQIVLAFLIAGAA